MEAASAVSHLPARLRARGFERECERLRPLGEAFVLRRFGGKLGRADAEDAVAEVLIRLHRQSAEGHVPQNLRASFFTGVRNAAIDILRSRAAKPTAPLEAVATAACPGAPPSERAESREDAVRLQEALARMRGNYREAILLRFGLGLSVPEIARQLDISLPAAKKLMLRATRQARERLASIEEAEFCPQIQEMARRSLFEREACGLADEAESEVLRAHLAHCGPCRSFALALHEHLHDLGAAALLGLTGAAQLGGRPGPLDRLPHLFGSLTHGLQSGAGRLRHLALRASTPLQPGDGAAGALLGSGQKIAAICGAGAAATATCLLTGAVGPGIGATAPVSHPHHRPPAKLKRLEAEAPQPTAPSPTPAPSSEAEAPREAAPAQERQPAPPPSPPSEFGVESGSASAGTASSSPPAQTSPAAGSGGEFGAAPSVGSLHSGSGSGGSAGFAG